jgi:hypothetical protein
MNRINRIQIHAVRESSFPLFPGKWLGSNQANARGGL